MFVFSGARQHVFFQIENAYATAPHLDIILWFEKLRRYALYFEVHLPGGFRLMYAFFFLAVWHLGVEFSDIWLSEGGLGSPFWLF